MTLDYGTLEIQEIPVIAPGGKGYTLREASGKVAKDHRNAIMACTMFDKEGKVTGLRDLASVESKFVSGCLFDENDKHPSFSEVESWPARVQKELYDKSKEISLIKEKDPPLVSLLKSALADSSAPLTLSEFSTWLSELDEDTYSPLQKAFEDSPKNSP